jgi:antitoxin component YwqK of YwqJK toxin-antitoxin module
MQGEWTGWHPNGQRKHRGSFLAGKEQGLWTYWYPHGQKHAEGAFSGGRRHGDWKDWLEDGSPDTARSGRYAQGVRQ